MLCYKDRTYCAFKKCKLFDVCDVALTNTIQEEATAFGLPISQYAEKPDCFLNKEQYTEYKQRAKELALLGD